MRPIHFSAKNKIWVSHYKEYQHHHATVFAVFENDFSGLMTVELLSKTNNGIYRTRHKTPVDYQGGSQHSLTQLLFNLAPGECAQLHISVEDNVGRLFEHHWSPGLQTV
ncbi:hypothetical protein M976_03457 [Buttiauxella ferragutiae ATCC 51602]|jgi:hypothetical protein|uniref:Uncharacterized protein n=1 Tax=Buttiauxella ferragutiae ATCC 51602 TaxID=1354252 RepID=A0ABX2W4Y4_9ENTR|nr:MULTISPECIES: hypothetical protein [Buttiauxella]AYN25852.1 hypothetical protein D8682_01935 [Buttiauxella sp. 3AFRM03]OAT25814.1 hypothetical protein M976_03457 [Buttiauxella ferragutiae ATCC 51602]TDN54075.1 hypothetical protein EC843_101116 [Buttiauxella sp. JUb87]